eukprot:361947-Chlamydomonas_euryale.AAC.15
MPSHRGLWPFRAAVPASCSLTRNTESLGHITLPMPLEASHSQASLQAGACAPCVRFLGRFLESGRHRLSHFLAYVLVSLQSPSLHTSHVSHNFSSCHGCLKREEYNERAPKCPQANTRAMDPAPFLHARPALPLTPINRSRRILTIPQAFRGRQACLSVLRRAGRHTN